MSAAVIYNPCFGRMIESKNTCFCFRQYYVNVVFKLSFSHFITGKIVDGNPSKSE